MTRAALLPLALVAACAPSTSPTEARIHHLEDEVAELRSELADRAASVPAGNASFMDKPLGHVRCTPADTSVAKGTTFDNRVAFELGRSDLRSGDRIVVTEVRGTTPDFTGRGVYLVRGEYTLASADAAVLTLTVASTDPHAGCTLGNPRARQAVKKGSGTFELATTFAYEGYPHVWFDRGDGASGGGVYFGKGAFLLR